MTTATMHERIKHLIEETNDAFIATDGAVNTDYAEYASLAFAEFQLALNDPEMTREDLVRLLRRGMTRSRIQCVDADEDCWSQSMAYYMARKASERSAHM